MGEPATLECDHCGCEAIESTDGTFAENMADACMTCGFPGHVSIEESGEDDDEGEPLYTATWSSTIDAGDTCSETHDCSECRDIRAALRASQQPGSDPKKEATK